MNKVFQGTTPSIKVFLNEDYDNPKHRVQDVSEIVIYLVQGTSFITKTLDDLVLDEDNNCFDLVLNEDDFYIFSSTVVNMQVKYKLKGSETTYGTPIVPIRVTPSLVGRDFRDLRYGFTSQEDYLWRIMKM